MEKSLLPKDNLEYNNAYELYKKIENSCLSTSIKHRRTIVKYTKLPAYESDAKVSWPAQKFCRLRLFTTLNDYDTRTSRSLKSNILLMKKMTSGGLPKRKIATITEDDENDLHPKFSRENKRSSLIQSTNRSVATDYNEEKLTSARNTSRFSTTSKCTNESKDRRKLNNTKTTKEISIVKSVNSRKNSNISSEHLEHGQLKHNKDYGINGNIKNSNVSTETIVSKNIITSENEREISFINRKLLKDVKSNSSPKKSIEKSKTSNSSEHIIKNKVTFLKEIQCKNKPVTVIHIPLDEKYPKINVNMENDENCSVCEDKNYKNVNIGTEPPPATVDQITEMDDFHLDGIKKYYKNTHIQTEVTNELFDSLDIPNVTLTKEKYDSKQEESVIDYKPLCDNEIPSAIPSAVMSPHKDVNDEIGLSYCSSYIISRATLTYTTQQKINFHVVESKDNNPCPSPSIQTPSTLYYPANVVTVFKNELNRNKDSDGATTSINNISEKWDRTDTNDTKCVNEVESYNCSYSLNSTKLMKPSDIIRTIKMNTGILQSKIPDEFQRELNFIDSFFESLQYLENSSSSAKCFADEKKVDNLVYGPELCQNVLNGKNSEYKHDDTETMTSKSLCLLNSLIRDEQRRAKNLLFVLKMREDALKEFATSQILWLENKKKHDNTDVSILKKKQRGALLKLQHECGEMQRMRKALLTLSEKRKIALMKTKKSLELKLKNNVDVDQIVLGKKKLKKCMSGDRNATPLKCFDLSSSGCDESTTSRHNSDAGLIDADVPFVATDGVKSAEKSIQTGDSGMPVYKSIEMTAENFVVVDGGYLNILFHNLSLPQIFSGGKQYEVNEEALKNIVNSSNSHEGNKDIEERVVDHSESRQGSTSPSTARSLVEEFDQYYNGPDRDESPAEPSDPDCKVQDVVYEMKDSSARVPQCGIERLEKRLYETGSTVTSERSDVNVFRVEQSCAGSPPVAAGPQLVPVEPPPVPVEAAIQPHSVTTSTISESTAEKETASQPAPSLSSLTSPADSEAEELRRQQLAIEREIKALEREQCQLLVVREIPDKPPPPYTPPVDSRIPKPSPLFLVDKETEGKVKRFINDPTTTVLDEYNNFDTFVKEFCHESVERHDSRTGVDPWDARDTPPQARLCDSEMLVQRTSSELCEVLSGAAPALGSGVGARRSDHIDDILFGEWRRCEPEWTSLHTDEAIVKNQIFDCIFQKILTETIDEYKKILNSSNTTTE